VLIVNCHLLFPITIHGYKCYFFNNMLRIVLLITTFSKCVSCDSVSVFVCLYMCGLIIFSEQTRISCRRSKIRNTNECSCLEEKVIFKWKKEHPCNCLFVTITRNSLVVIIMIIYRKNADRPIHNT